MRRLLIFLVMCGVATAASINMPVFDGEDWIRLEYIGEDASGTNVKCYRQGDNWKALITLDRPPDVNYWMYRIEDEGQFNYFYQEPFKEYETVFIDGEEWHGIPDFGGYSQRPAYMEGSWAVYHKWKRDHAIGRTNYRNGKAFHIIADAWDASGEHILRGHRPTDASVRAAAAAAIHDVNPEGDLHATAAYRRKLVAALTRRAIVEAAERAGRTG